MSQKILIVDDEPHIRMLLEQTLDELVDEGVEVFLATNGQEGLDAVAAEKPDLVMLDVMMPLVNGFDVCRQIRANPETANVYVMMLTAKGQDLDRATGDEVGVDVYITKPFDPDDVRDRAAKVLGIEL